MTTQHNLNTVVGLDMKMKMLVYVGTIQMVNVHWVMKVVGSNMKSIKKMTVSQNLNQSNVIFVDIF